MHHFCTYFDRNYLTRGLALYRSLERHCPSFEFWVLCMDDETYKILSDTDLPNMRLISLNEFEKDDGPLLAAKQNRSRFEYYFTCTPSLVLFVLRQCPKGDVITYLDADLFFYSDLAPVYDELGSNSMLIIGHRFPETLKHLEDRGIYNVGLLAFRNDDSGRSALQWWRERCLENCQDRPEGGRFADQKYLDDWPQRFRGVVILQHTGAGLAPWNVSRYHIHRRNGVVMVDSMPLVFYHFHHLQILGNHLFDPCLTVYRSQLGGVLKNRIYLPYVRELRSLTNRTRFVAGNSPRNDPTSGDLRDRMRLLLYGRPLFVLGPLNLVVHLEPIARPFLAIRKLVMGRRQTSPA